MPVIMPRRPAAQLLQRTKQSPPAPAPSPFCKFQLNPKARTFCPGYQSPLIVTSPIYIDIEADTPESPPGTPESVPWQDSEFTPEYRPAPAPEYPWFAEVPYLMLPVPMPVPMRAPIPLNWKEYFSPDREITFSRVSKLLTMARPAPPPPPPPYALHVPFVEHAYGGFPVVPGGWGPPPLLPGVQVLAGMYSPVPMFEGGRSGEGCWCLGWGCGQV